MRANRTSSIRILMLVGCMVAVAGLPGCKKKASTAPSQVALSGPAPGPIIDTSGDPSGQLTHRYGENALSKSSGDTASLDARFFTKMYSAVLVETGNASGPVTYGLGKDVEVTFNFTDGTSYKVTMGDTAQELTWMCSDVAGNKDVSLVKGNAGFVPDCMRTSNTRKLDSIKASTGETGDLLIISTYE